MTTITKQDQARLDLLAEINQIYREHPSPSVIKALTITLCRLIDEEIEAREFITELAICLKLISNGPEGS